MKKIILLTLVISLLCLALPVKAADEAVFSATSDQTSYDVGDDVRVSLNVDAGPYSSTLSVIDFKVKISDPSVVAPVGSSPLTLGSIYTNTVTQSYSDGIVSAAVFIDPNNKPANRSGVIATMTLKAQKEGQAIISYPSIQATEEDNELDFISTSASSLTVIVGPAVSAEATKTSSSSSAAVAHTATPQPGRASTGPKETLLFSLMAGTVIFLVIRWYRKLNSTSGNI